MICLATFSRSRSCVAGLDARNQARASEAEGLRVLAGHRKLSISHDDPLPLHLNRERPIDRHTGVLKEASACSDLMNDDLNIASPWAATHASCVGIPNLHVPGFVRYHKEFVG